MLDWMFIMVLAIAIVIFIVIMFFESVIQKQWLLGLVVFDVVLWWSLAMANFQIEIPWEMFNASSGEIETGYHVYTSLQSPALFYILFAPGVIMFVYMVYLLYVIIRDFYEKYILRRV